MQTNKTIDMDSHDQNRNNVSGFGLYDISSNDKKQIAKSDQKVYRARSRRIQEDIPPSISILREKCMNSVKCNLWTNDINSATPSPSEDQRVKLAKEPVKQMKTETNLAVKN